MPWRSAGISLLLLCLVASTGCWTRYRRTVVRDQNDVRVVLRAQVEGGSEIPRGFDHPATISGVRMGHILAAIDVRLKDGDGSRQPAVPTELVFVLGDATASALAQANPNQEVVVRGVRKRKSLGIFDDDYVTSFIAWVKGDELYIHMRRADDLVAKGEEKKIKEPRLEKEDYQSFKILPGEAIIPIARQSAAVAWKDPSFRRTSHIRVDSRGRVSRRQVLMDSVAPEEVDIESNDVAPISIPEDPEVLQQLLDLEKERRAGQVSEQDYQRRRRELLQNPL